MTDVEKNLLTGLSPLAVADWLRMRDFKVTENLGENGAILKREVAFGDGQDSETQELLLPTSSTASDFARRMAALVADLSDFEKRSTYEIISDLSLAPFDVIKVRSADADEYGSMRLGAGLDIHEQARQMVVAAANSAASPVARKSWRGRRFEEVDQYISSLRLGQSQKGSFVLNILSRWDFVPDGPPALDFGETIFGRQVTKRLADALQSIERSIKQAVASGPDVFVKSFRYGVSANICQALARLASEGDGIDISINWSPSKIENENVRVAFKRDDSAILNEAARLLAAEEDEPDFLMEGLVARITEPPEEFSGAAVIEGYVGQSLRKVRVHFDVVNRDLIYDAAKQKKWVRLSGDLSRANNRLALNRPKLIEIIDPEEIAKE